jgi:glucose/arabinose dehydrogenase
MDIYFIKSLKKEYSILTSIILFTLAFLSIEFLQIENNNVLAQSVEVIDTTSRNNVPSTDIFNLITGYTIEPIVWNLTAPDSLAFDKNGNMYIGEAGYPLTRLPEVPKILKVTPNGNISEFVDKGLNSPVVDVVYYNETTLYVSHNHKVSIVNLTNGTVKDIIVGLPTNVNHQNNQIAFSTEGKRLYVGIGSATNSGVVGEDDAMIGWLPNEPNVHDVPGNNIILTGQNFVSNNPLTAEPNDIATTGAFVPFNTTTIPGQMIQGNIKCNGCIISANLDGTDLKVVGWGFRNPTGLAFNEEGKLFAVSHGADQRGNRPIANDSDKLYDVKLNETAFYGWPDFFGNAEPVTDPKFQSKGSDKSLQFVIQNHPSVEKPLIEFEVGAALAQIDFSFPTSTLSSSNSTNDFGLKDMAFIAEFGIMIPTSHLPWSLKNQNQEIVGQKVIVLNPQNKSYSDFVSLDKPDTSFRPVGIAFNKNENTLYITSISKVEIRTTLPNGNNIGLSEPSPWYYPNTGVIWKVTKTSSSSSELN